MNCWLLGARCHCFPGCNSSSLAPIVWRGRFINLQQTDSRIQVTARDGQLSSPPCPAQVRRGGAPTPRLVLFRRSRHGPPRTNSSSTVRSRRHLPRDTGFPEPFDEGSNTTLPHPEADLSPNDTISQEEVAV